MTVQAGTRKITIGITFLVIALLTCTPAQTKDTRAKDTLTKDMRANRIISLDYCADQYVLALAEKSQIAAVSKDAVLSHSFYRDRVGDIPTIRPTADLILSLKPDLVVTSWISDPRLFTILKRLNIPVHQISLPPAEQWLQTTMLELSKQSINAAAKAFGTPKKADKLVAGIEKQYSAMINHQVNHQINQQEDKPKALYMTPGAYSTGSGTIIHQILTLAGVKNYLADLGYKGWVPLPLEQLVSKTPDLVISGFYDVQSAVNFNWGVARHDFLKDKMDATVRIDVPGSILSCSGLFAVQTAYVIHTKLKQQQAP